MQQFYEPGHRLGYVEDVDGDGEPDRIVDWVYDSEGRVVEYLLDEDGDGVIDEFWDIQTNADGDYLRAEGDIGGDGIINELSVYSYDTFGERVRTEYDFNVPEDDGFEYVEVVVFDDLRREIERRIEESPDDESYWIAWFEYEGDSDRLSRNAYDVDNDGVADGWWDYVWDGDVPIEAAWTDPSTGGITQVRVREFDDRDRIVRRRYYWGDRDELYEDTTWDYDCPDLDVDGEGGSSLSN